MNRTLLGFIFLMASHNAFSQFRENPLINLENFDKQPVHWGYFLGINQYGFDFDYKELDDNANREIQVSRNIGFNVGLIGDLRINDYMNLRLEPGLYYNQRDLHYFGIRNNDGSFNAEEGIKEVKSTYIHVPLLLKVGTKRLGNIKPYIVGGISGAINLGSNADSKEDIGDGKFRMKKHAYFYEIGFGIDFYLYYFKFSPSIRGVFALSDEHIPDNEPDSPYTGNINNMYSRGIFLNLTFE
ncbi:type IX secretion/gliding motility protein PorT/SprT [Sinomicrobium soli]|uniref:type IX secretion/gliding motility protein PorT/SprT n=1 Tax=Sinomicrobium sp. N-1-3-6 TaxID=2219864 RepID=UPI000DCE8336|nr:porin family protein [Sinomicrobium sp. N-1-3-6]RAV29663.1 PorT family protein [Sinomicrobium sp. N-1-3-6]